LQMADLSYGNFSGADFRCAKLENCNMTGAILSHAKMDEKYRDSLPLTENQKEEIVWIS